MSDLGLPTGVHHTSQGEWEEKRKDQDVMQQCPCDDWDFEACMCKGACSCHWDPGLYHLYSDGTDTFVAESFDEAKAIAAAYFKESYGEDPEDWPNSLDELKQIPDEEKVKLHSDDDGLVHEKSAGEWAMTMPTKGIFSSTEF